MAWIESAPLWLVWPALAALLVLSQEVGFRTKRWTAPRQEDTAKGEDGVGYLLSAALALLGLLIAFTFSMSAQRFDLRRQLVVAESNAVGTTYLRYQLLDEPERKALSTQLISYLDARADFFRLNSGPAEATSLEERTARIETGIWTALSKAIRAHPQATVNPSLLQATNEMFDLADTDRAARDARVPVTIIRVLCIYAMVAAGILGHSLASGSSRHFIAATALLILLALAISLILDLDRSTTGTIHVSHASFDRTVQGIKAEEAATVP